MGEERRPLLISARGLMGLRTLCVEREGRQREKTRKKTKQKYRYILQILDKICNAGWPVLWLHLETALVMGQPFIASGTSFHGEMPHPH